MQFIDYVFIALGLLCICWGIYSMIVKKYSKERLELYTLESLNKYAVVEGILTIVSGVGILIAGFSNSGVILPKSFIYVGWILVIVVLVVEFILEPKMLVKKNKEDKK